MSYDIDSAVKALCAVLPQEGLIYAHEIIIEQALNTAYVQGKADGAIIMGDLLKDIAKEVER